MEDHPKYKFGLGLSGGGARGAAHVGVLQAFKEAGLVPEVIAGTSAGAIVGALYASGMSSEAMMDFISSSSLFKAYRPCLPSNGITPFTYLHKKLAELIAEDSFEALNIPLHIATTNLERGEVQMFSEGELFKVVQAAGSIPLVFKPVEINGEWHVDGGAMNNFPVQSIRSDCQLLVGVNIMPTVPVQKKAVKGFFGLSLRAVYLGIAVNSKPGKALCDILIEPDELYHYDIFRFNKTDEIYQIGYDHGLKAIPEIKAKLAALSDQTQPINPKTPPFPPAP